MPATLVSELAFGDYVFPAGFYLAERSLAPLKEDARLSKIAGSVGHPFSLGPNVVRVVGTIGGTGAQDSNGAPISTLDDARAEANRMAAALKKKGPQKLVAGAADGRYLLCHNRRCMVQPMLGTGQGALVVELEFLAGDPRWLSNTLRTAHYVTTVSGNFTSLGSAQTYPKFTHTGALVADDAHGHLFVLVNWGGLSRGFEFGSITLLSADVLVIECDPAKRGHAIQLNGVDRFDLLAGSFFGALAQTEGDSSDGFPAIPPAGHSWDFTFGNFNTMDVEWRDAWHW